MQQNPYRLLAFSFLGVMIIGTILLMLPMASAQGQTTALVDAAFTAVSCVSVTGLTTVDTYYHWSLFICYYNLVLHPYRLLMYSN